MGFQSEETEVIHVWVTAQKNCFFFGKTFLAQPPDDKDNTPQEHLLSTQEEKDYISLC